MAKDHVNPLTRVPLSLPRPGRLRFHRVGSPHVYCVYWAGDGEQHQHAGVDGGGVPGALRGLPLHATGTRGKEPIPRVAVSVSVTVASGRDTGVLFFGHLMRCSADSPQSLVPRYRS
jgi:hypothetical protein